MSLQAIDGAQGNSLFVVGKVRDLSAKPEVNCETLAGVIKGVCLNVERGFEAFA